MGAVTWRKRQSYTYTLVFSSLSYGLIFGLYMFVYSGFVPFALVTVVIIAFYAFITYFLFAVPVQLWLRKKPKKFSLVHLFIYTAVAFLAVFLFWHIDNPSIDFTVFRSFIYYIMSIVAAFIYWFWDSIFLRNYNVHCK
ncbi:MULTISPECIES: UPF0715 family protein [Bacillus]|uniref:UPF0715 family protein n=1 Tax=Bacillus TaxID=1386 RepID=UPI0006CCE2ED|nr:MULTISPECIES: UPF0715 family protein [Bacillus]AMR52473.1 hypothetical protein A1R12_08730 [Bacillus amyloliquefaciens]KPD37324.1 hypothetical protein AN475_05300 [Bacillus amyloliquefaciens]MDN4140442.1 UPF0715 family protein [Bacillus velezensis]MDV9184427.1 UPF0715 family protein [Bacillus sp. 31]QGU47527.1 hypothetical protein GG619_08845 [Bacillus velezensis]